VCVSLFSHLLFEIGHQSTSYDPQTSRHCPKTEMQSQRRGVRQHSQRMGDVWNGQQNHSSNKRKWI